MSQLTQRHGAIRRGRRPLPRPHGALRRGRRGDRTAEVSPDGRLVAVAVEIRDGLEGRGHAELHLLAVDGTRRWQVTGAGVDATDPRWSTAVAPRSRSSRTSARAIGRRRSCSRSAPTGRWASRDAWPAPPGFPELQRPTPDGVDAAPRRWRASTPRWRTGSARGASASCGCGRGHGRDGHDNGPPWTPAVETHRRRGRVADDVAARPRERRRAPGLARRHEHVGGRLARAQTRPSWSPPTPGRGRAGTRRASPGLDLATAIGDDLYRGEWQLQFAARRSPDGTRLAVIEGVASDRYFMAGRAPRHRGGRLRVRGRWRPARRRPRGPLAGRRAARGVRASRVWSRCWDRGTDGSWHETWRAGPAGGRWGCLPSRRSAHDGDSSSRSTVRSSRSGSSRSRPAPSAPLGTPAAGPRRAGRRPCHRARRRVDSAATGRASRACCACPAASRRTRRSCGCTAARCAAVGRFRRPVMAALSRRRATPSCTRTRADRRAAAARSPRRSSGDMGGEDAQDLLAGVEWLIAEGIADPARIAVAG